MENQILQFLIPGIGLISGLIATYVSLQNRALLAEVRKELAELESRITTRIGDTFVRSGECRLRSEGIQRQFTSVVGDVAIKATAALLRDENLQARITTVIEDIGIRTIDGLLREEIVLSRIAALSSGLRDRDARDRD